jgi:hypothetical protein
MVIDTSSTEGEIVYKPPAGRRDSFYRAFLARKEPGDQAYGPSSDRRPDLICPAPEEQNHRREREKGRE